MTTSERLIGPATFDALVEGVGNELAVEILTSVRNYVAGHSCRLDSIEVELERDESGPRRVEVKYHHAVGCPAAHEGIAR